MDKISIKTPAQTLIESYSHGNEQKSFLIRGARAAGKSEYLRNLVQERLKKGEKIICFTKKH